MINTTPLHPPFRCSVSLDLLNIFPLSASKVTWTRKLVESINRCLEILLLWQGTGVHEAYKSVGTCEPLSGSWVLSLLPHLRFSSSLFSLVLICSFSLIPSLPLPFLDHFLLPRISPPSYVFYIPFLQVSEAYEMVYSKVNFVKTFELTATQSLLWYLREETMEMQLIISTNTGGNNNNNSNDSLPSGSSQRIVGAVQVGAMCSSSSRRGFLHIFFSVSV